MKPALREGPDLLGSPAPRPPHARVFPTEDGNGHLVSAPHSPSPTHPPRWLFKGLHTDSKGQLATPTEPALPPPASLGTLAPREPPAEAGNEAR